MGRRAACADACQGVFRSDTDDVEPGGFASYVPPGALVHLDRESVLVVVAGSWQAERSEQARLLRVLKYAAKSSDLSHGNGAARWVLFLAQVTQRAPRPARRMRHHRRRANVQARVTRLIPAAIGTE
jgi:hypothetical protein